LNIAERNTPVVPRSNMGFITPAGRSLLIVEEDVPLANFLSRELHASSFSVDLVYDGETAWSTLREQRRHDLLIVELNLPKLDGLTLLKRVRLAHPRLPMMVLTARSRVEDKVAAFQSGADDFLAKPFSVMELIVRVHALLRRHSCLIQNTSSVTAVESN
jgi:DNA-binding response OmpR family regulator